MKEKSIYNGQYTLVNEIAFGGFATIYRAIDHTGNDKTVAIKLARHSGREYEAAIRKEAELLPRFQHDNIVKLLPIKRIGKTESKSARAIELPDEPAFYVMEYLAGGTLESYLKRVDSLPPEDAAAIGLGIARGLDHMHVRGYAHNDLKLENIVFRTPLQNGEPYDPVLIDFGIATRVASPDGGSMYIMPPEVIDQIHLAAPELINIDSYKADVWGLGVVLYRMMGGKLPFVGRNERTLTQRIKFTAPTSLSELSDLVPPELNDLVVNRCLAKDMKYRPTVLEVGKELRKLGEGVVFRQAQIKPKRGIWGRLLGR